jgi:phytoene dehydrogenase-like protein
MNWDADFAGHTPIKLPDGRTLETLADLREYILELPQREQQEARWQQATAELLRAAELGGGWPFFARPAFSRALHGVSGVGPPPKVLDKNAAWQAKRAARKR